MHALTGSAESPARASAVPSFTWLQLAYCSSLLIDVTSCLQETPKHLEAAVMASQDSHLRLELVPEFGERAREVFGVSVCEEEEEEEEEHQQEEEEW
ncbi:hypothetical protein E2C01_004415 [Portunus trituberculatus]|uniref:Uncharacterized protein n=1 Tax=Portunus trituberculatus TaxID=210409 RepID=A0A5B7CSB1_PORTR|nr:hypothetical protein [Portunus trituberculatus]